MKFLFYVLRSIWKHQNGRWYVWRDVPIDIVRFVAATRYFVRKEPPSNYKSFLYEAHREYQLRNNK